MKKNTIISLIIISLAFVLSLLFDKTIVTSISSLQQTWLNQIMVLVSYLGIALVLIFLSTCLFLIHDRRKILSVWFSFAITSILVFLSKIFIYRSRPFEELGLTTLNFLVNATYTTWNFSFPSFHTAITFSVIPFLKGKIKIYWILFACLVGFSRLFFALHYLSDIIAGALIGLIVGEIFMNLFHLKKGVLK